MLKLLTICTVTFWFLLAAPFGVIYAESITIFAQVGDTKLTLEGYFSANSLITFVEDDSVIGTSLTDTNGFFQKELTAMNPGLHSITIRGTDPGNKQNIGILKDIFLIGFQSHLLQNIFLPPTIHINKTFYEKGENIIIDGYSKPNSVVEIDINGPIGKFLLTATDSEGYYKHLISVDKFEDGNYVITAMLKNSLLETSEASLSIQFSIKTEENISTVNPGSPPDIIRDLCLVLYPNYPKLCSFDKERKGYLNVFNELQDIVFGIIRYYQQSVSNIYDLNGDGMVTSEDLSIALYYTQPQYQVLGLDTQSNEIDDNQSSTKGVSTNTLKNDLSESLLNWIKIQLVLIVVLLILFLAVFIYLRANGKYRGNKK